MTHKPFFKHDCDSCFFLGNFIDKESDPLDPTKYDLYYHSHFLTVIGRYGDEGYEYTSGIPSSQPVLKEALNRALCMGLCKVIDNV